MIDYSKYAKGEILVHSKNNKRDSFAREFLERKGYTLSEERYKHSDYSYIVKVPEGKEEEFLKEFDSFPEFLEGASLRNIEEESRWEDLEHVRSLMDKLHSSIGFMPLSSEEYNKEIEKIREYLGGIKER